jgi:hypothetical protein
VKITKQNDTYDTYRVEISMGQLLGIRDALRNSHAGPVADEMLTEIDWYLNQLPGPGETKDDMEAAQNGAPIPTNVEDMDIDVELPAPDEEPSEAGAEISAETGAEDEVPLEAPEEAVA